VWAHPGQFAEYPDSHSWCFPLPARVNPVDKSEVFPDRETRLVKAPGLSTTINRQDS
jgi:hypothetical protein